MVLPHSWLQSILLAILAMVCLVSWAQIYKLGGRWRFELFYLDFTVGFAVVGIICAFTFGSLGFDGFSFMDDLGHASSRSVMFGLGAGIALNLGTLLLTAAISVSGLAVAFSISTAFALVVTAILSLYARGMAELPAMIAGSLVSLAACFLMASGYSQLVRLTRKSIPRDAKGRPAYKLSAIKPILLAAFAGPLLSLAGAFMTAARRPEVGVGPYALVALVSVAVLLSTIVFSLIFMNLPVQGEPVDAIDYFKSGLKKHGLGLLAGALWCCGVLGLLIASEGTAEYPINRSQYEAILWSAPLAAGILGTLVWKEMKGAPGSLKTTVSFVLVAAAIAIITYSSLVIKTQ